MAEAAKFVLTGHVQGVGFRPFVYRLAREHELTGYVQNRLGEVAIVACGPSPALRRFEKDLLSKAPPLAKPEIRQRERIDSPGFSDFEIVASAGDAKPRVFVPPDNFMCDDCRRELHDSADRRHRYPFINCTQCGPRYTLIEALPYDRANTSMAAFPLCKACLAEYESLSDRRFHAEPVACADCGPSIDRSLADVIDDLRAGLVVAVKGIGGYHLMCDAHSEAAVARLRDRKRRPHKPLAVMFPMRGEDGLDSVRRYVSMTNNEAATIASPGRPIVLATQRDGSGLAANIAPGLREIGVFLPYSPLHDLLLEACDGPLVATSGNISGEPVLTDNEVAAEWLGNIADSFLHHDRPIVRPADDPVYRDIAGGVRPVRIGRGCAPLETRLHWYTDEVLLSVGGHMKGTVALGWEDRAVVSPHIGEMDSPRSLAVLEQLVEDLQSLYGVRATRVIADAHPAYTTHRWARRQGLPVDIVWHHEAHASAAVAEAGGGGRWLVFAWDGVGFGRDGTLWGGEILHGNAGDWQRVASLRTFRPPGGDKAGREPWRSAAAMHWECGLDWQPVPDPDGLARTAWQRGLNSPVTSAAGRVFDAAAAVICDLPFASFEAQGPMLLEALCREVGEAVALPLSRDVDGVLRADWEPLLAVIGDSDRDARSRAESVHTSMAQLVADLALALRDDCDFDHVALTGGVFQNRVLAEQACARLERAGIQAFLPRLLPCNDAGLSFGQLAEVAAKRAVEHDG